MAGYFGTPSQRGLQALAEDCAAFAETTPGACQAGRMVGCDDPERLGWDRIAAFIDRDGVCGFRLVDAARVDDIRTRLEQIACRFDTWDVFLADRETALAACEPILARPLPEDLHDRPMPADPEGADTMRIQQLMAESGIVPFSGSMLAGRIAPAVTVSLGDRDGGVVAAGHGYMPHNAHSPHRRHAWGGLVAVAAEARGKGLGARINAALVRSVFRNLDATHVYELVSTTNVASRRMVESCGLRHEPHLVCGIASPLEASRFTR